MKNVRKDFDSDSLFAVTIPTTEEDVFNMKIPSIAGTYEWIAFQDRKLYIDFEIYDSLIQYIKYILYWNKEDQGKKISDRKPINIYIYSPGGDPYIAYSFIDVLKLSKTPIKLINLGMCASAAGYIFMCKEDHITRYMLSSAHVLIHDGQIGLQSSAGKFMDMAETLKQDEKRNKKYILENTTIKEKLYEKKKRVEWDMTASEALKLGVCDVIIDNINEVI